MKIRFGLGLLKMQASLSIRDGVSMVMENWLTNGLMGIIRLWFGCQRMVKVSPQVLFILMDMNLMAIKYQNLAFACSVVSMNIAVNN